MPACYVPACLKKKHNACKAVWFTNATVHWSNFCIFVDSIDSQIILRMIRESKTAFHLDKRRITQHFLVFMGLTEFLFLCKVKSVHYKNGALSLQ